MNDDIMSRTEIIDLTGASALSDLYIYARMSIDEIMSDLNEMWPDEDHSTLAASIFYHMP